VCSVLALPGLVRAQARPPLPSSRPPLRLEIVPGEDLPHWSGLPIWGKAEAEKLGFELPLPIGLSATYYTETQGFHLPELKLGRRGGRMFDVGGLVRVPEITATPHVKTLRLDGWVLPFLNLYGFVGHVDGHADVPIQPAVFPPAASPEFDLRVGFDGLTLGLGGALAAGFKPFEARPTIVFGLADLSVTETFFDFNEVLTSLDPVTAVVLNVRCGVRERILRTTSLGDVHLSLWGGFMWQGVQGRISGDLSILHLAFQGRVEAASPWSTIIGGSLEIGKHSVLTIDVGIGERRSLLLSAAFRF
jgi:hypothetical protein